MGGKSVNMNGRKVESLTRQMIKADKKKKRVRENDSADKPRAKTGKATPHPLAMNREKDG